MHHPLIEALHCLLEGNDLSTPQMQAAMGAVMDGAAGEAQIAALLTALRIKGETVDELTGAARAMIQRASRVHTARKNLLDTCGTGGDALRTFNISTATALVVAAGGVPVAKHGNRSVSSSSGSADVLAELGLRIELTPQQVGRCLDEIGIGFCFAPLLHGAMKHVAAVRRQLGFRTIFNLLGPLTNPAGAEYQLVGAHTPLAAEKLANALLRLGRTHAIVVCGNAELDEVSLWGSTRAWIVEQKTLRQEEWTAGSFGLPECRVEELQVDSPAQSADVIRRLLHGERGPARDIVVANAAAALLAAQKATDLPAAAAQAADVLQSGRAAELLERFVALSRSFPR